MGEGIYMFSKTRFSKMKENCPDYINRLREKMEAADAIVIGAGAGLSTSAGLVYEGERFHKYFADFEEKYGFHDMYSGGFYPYKTLEEHWAYWSRYITINRYEDVPKPVYKELFSLVKKKEYFVITTNVDHCFQRAGFEKQRLFYTQGDYGLFQCSVPCHGKTYDNEETIRKMVVQQKEMHIPSGLIPRCPVCGKPLIMNLRCDNKFVEDEGWHIASRHYSEFLDTWRGREIVFLELGVGYNTPIIIKYPFWQMTEENPNATYVCINYGEAACPSQITKQSICINADISEVVNVLIPK